MAAEFSELRSTAGIAVRGADAVSFLHAQLTSDIAGLAPLKTQYSGYCTPKGRLLAIFLVWRFEDEIILQLPDSLRASVQTRLSRYVLRAQVKFDPAIPDYSFFGLWGNDAQTAVARIVSDAPEGSHDVVVAGACRITRLSGGRFVVAAPNREAAAVREALGSGADEHPESVWRRHEIEAGIPMILPETQEEYVPQMVNLDLIGGVSYTKGCYPGQEIVARTRYLGRLKQRMYRIHARTKSLLSPGDRLYSAAFGDQASGAILYAAPGLHEGQEALAVIQSSVTGTGAVHWKSPDGLNLELKPLPYPVPA